MGLVLVVQMIQASGFQTGKGGVHVSVPVYKYMYYVQIYRNMCIYIPRHTHTHISALHAHSIIKALFVQQGSHLSVMSVIKPIGLQQE